MGTWLDQHGTWTCLQHIQLLIHSTHSPSYWRFGLRPVRKWGQGESFILFHSTDCLTFDRIKMHEIYLTNSHHLSSWKRTIFMMNWTPILAWMLKTSLTPSNGGMNISHGWSSIILPYLVCISCIQFHLSSKYIIATSIDVKRLFSKGHILIPHLHSCLSSQSICALLCLESWSVLGYVKNDDVKEVVSCEGGADKEAADADLW